MAQTRRRRRTKHRGNAAGVVEARGRTGRKPTAAEKGSPSAQSARTKQQRREERYDRPPTWRGAFYRALFAAVALWRFQFGESKSSKYAQFDGRLPGLA